MGSVHAEQHSKGGGYFYLLQQQTVFGVALRGVGWLGGSLGQVLLEGMKVQVLGFDPAFSKVPQMVGRHGETPGGKTAFAPEAVEPCDDLDQYFLGGILGVLGVPKHPDRKPIKEGLEALGSKLQGPPVTTFGLRCQFL